MHTETQIRKLLYNWDIEFNEELIIHYGMGGGAEANNTWGIGDKYAFKTGRSIAGLRTHITIANALKKRGFIASYPIKTKKSEDFLVIDDRYYVLLNRIKGDRLNIEDICNGDRVRVGNTYGEAIGKLHKVLQEGGDIEQVIAKNIFETVVNWALPETKAVMEQWGIPLPNDFFQEYTLEFGKLYPKLPHQIIHRDPNPSNILFANSEVSGFIDFEICEKNVRIFDLCYCATAILSEIEMVDGGFEKWTELLVGIIQGYDKVCILTEEEKKAIPYVIYSIQMIFIAWASKYENFKSLSMINRKILLLIWEKRDKLFLYP